MRYRTVDISTAFGLLTALGLVIAAILMGQGALGFLDPAAMLIVLGGTIGVTIACFTLREIFHAFGLIGKTVWYREINPTDAARQMLEYAEIARKDSVLGLQNHLATAHFDSFLDNGLTMAVDGMDPEQMESLLHQDLQSFVDRHSKGVTILRKAAEVAPAMGLLGTLIGLVQMLGTLDDPSSIGPAMAVALLTTFYGALLAYMVFGPLAAKLERNTQEEILVKRLFMEGVLSIAHKENPRTLETALNTILPPMQRIQYFM